MQFVISDSTQPESCPQSHPLTSPPQTFKLLVNSLTVNTNDMVWFRSCLFSLMLINMVSLSSEWSSFLKGRLTFSQQVGLDGGTIIPHLKSWVFSPLCMNMRQIMCLWVQFGPAPQERSMSPHLPQGYCGLNGYHHSFLHKQCRELSGVAIWTDSLEFPLLLPSLQ